MEDKKFNLKINQLSKMNTPYETEFDADENYNEEEEVSAENGYDENLEGYKQPENQDKESNKEEKKEEQKEEKKNDEGASSEQDGKYFVIPKGMAQCNQGIAFPNFKVTSHQKHYWNDAEGEADYLAVTEDDTTFSPAAQPFGAQCKLQPTSSGYKPCSYAPAGKWQKCYDKVKVMGKSCVTEISELQCVIGGKITVKNHGQQSKISKINIRNAKPREQHVYNPIMDFGEFQEEQMEGETEAW